VALTRDLMGTDVHECVCSQVFSNMGQLLLGLALLHEVTISQCTSRLVVEFEDVL